MKKNVYFAAIACCLSLFTNSLMAKNELESTKPTGITSITYNVVNGACTNNEMYKNEIKGFNIKVRHEKSKLDSIGWMISFLRMQYTESSRNITLHTKLRYFSLTNGLSYTIKPFNVTFYGLLGIAHDSVTKNFRYTQRNFLNASNSSIAYTLGLQFQPIEHFILDTSFERTYKPFINTKTSKVIVNYTFGIGYTF